MKIYFSFIFLVVFFCVSCVGHKKYARLMNEKMNKLRISDTSSRDWLVVNMPSKVQNSNNIKQKKLSFIPALFFWSWNTTLDCQLNSDYSAALLKQTIYRRADSLNLKELLEGRSVTINIKQLPSQFVYTNKGYCVIFVVGYVMGSKEYITPLISDLEGDFKIGGYQIVFRDVNQQKPLKNVWKSTKKFTWLYLDDYRNEIERMGNGIAAGIAEKCKSLK